jgi:hypothetical protein
VGYLSTGGALHSLRIARRRRSIAVAGPQVRMPAAARASSWGWNDLVRLYRPRAEILSGKL